MSKFIVCAALRGSNWTVLCGPRHYDKIMHDQIDQMELPEQFYHLSGNAQGFVDNSGEYFTRKEALIIAQEAGQLRGTKHFPKDELLSEDLY